MHGKASFFGLILLLILCFQETSAQSFYNWKRDRKLMIGVGIGTTNYYGDLRNTGQVLNFNPNVALNVEYPVSPHLNIRGEFMYYQIAASDNDYAGDDSPESRYIRNLSFRSNNFELNAVAVFSLYKENVKYYQRSQFNPYFLLGIGATTNNPKAKYQGDWYKLRDIQTEGVNYSGLGVVIPFGMGVKYKVTNTFNMAFEAAYRITFTDYLDDVSGTYIDQSNFSDPVEAILADRRQELGLRPASEGKIRGNPDSNDGYLVISIKGSYYLPTSQWLRKMGSKKPKRLR